MRIDMGAGAVNKYELAVTMYFRTFRMCSIGFFALGRLCRYAYQIHRFVVNLHTADNIMYIIGSIITYVQSAILFRAVCWCVILVFPCADTAVVVAHLAGNAVLGRGLAGSTTITSWIF